MHAELQVLSPLVPVREVNFLRFCKQHAEGVWAVVDVSIDTIRENSPSFSSCRRLPSGCVVQDMPNGYSKVSHCWLQKSSSFILVKFYLLKLEMCYDVSKFVKIQCDSCAFLISWTILIDLEVKSRAVWLLKVKVLNVL